MDSILPWIVANPGTAFTIWFCFIVTYAVMKLIKAVFNND